MKKYVSPLLLLLTAIIWGFAFVAQKEGSNTVGAFTLTAARSFIGGIVLIPVILIFGKKAPQPIIGSGNKKILALGGTLCGIMLFAGTAFQQLGLTYGADAGKAGFITALYIVLVPVVNFLLGKKVNIRAIICVFIALIGLYLICMKGFGKISIGDGLVLACAFFFTLQILVIDRFSPRVECLKMSCIQFFVCGTLSLLFMFIMGESVTLTLLKGAIVPILYLGIMSSGIAYTLQIIGQRGTEPTLAAILMSLESVFAVLGGLIFGERLTLKEGLGCVIMFIAIIISQLPNKKCK